MKQTTRGFVLVPAMVIIMIIALLSLMLLRADMVNSQSARVSVSLAENTFKGKAWLKHFVSSQGDLGGGCELAGLSPDALLHASETWWKAHACTTPDGLMVLQEPPVVSTSAIMALPSGRVAAAFWRVSLRLAASGEPPVLLQALVAGPSNQAVQDGMGKVVVVPGIQQLVCVTD